MKKKSLIVFLTIFITILLAFSGTKPFTADTAAGLSANEDVEPALSRVNPTLTAEPICQSMEQEILDSTMRIMLFSRRNLRSQEYAFLFLYGFKPSGSLTGRIFHIAVFIVL
jgi:hypothetical protein